VKKKNKKEKSPIMVNIDLSKFQATLNSGGLFRRELWLTEPVPPSLKSNKTWQVQNQRLGFRFFRKRA
jgi:hypothetical protein